MEMGSSEIEHDIEADEHLISDVFENHSGPNTTYKMGKL